MKNKNKINNQDKGSRERQEIKDLLELISQERHERILEREIERKEREQEKNKYQEAMLRLQKKDFWWKYLSFLLGLIIATTGYYFFWEAGKEQARDTALREYRKHTADIIRADMNEKKEMLKASVSEMRDMRTVDYKIVLRCKYHHPYTMERQQWLRRLVSDGTIKAFTLSPYVFNILVYNSFVEFINYDNNVKDLCKIKDPDQYDSELLEIENKTKDLMAKAIYKDNQKLENLK